MSIVQVSRPQAGAPIQATGTASGRARTMLYMGLDVALWYLAPALFLFAYVQQYSAPATAVAPHLLLAALPLVSLWLARIVLTRAIPSDRVARFACSCVITFVFVVTLLYYGIELIGLHSWGGLVAWDVIPTFFVQAPQMLDMLGAPPAIAIVALGLLYVGLSVLCWLYLRRFDWVAPAVRSMSGWAVTALVLCAAASVAVECYRFATDSWKDAAEPVSLTFFPLERDLEGHAIDRLTAANVDQLEDAARRAYTPAAATTPRRNVVLIVVDALRADHMSINGYPRATTPNLTRLAQAGAARSLIAHSSCGDTICGLLSLATSKFPRAFSFRPFSLHEALARNGYRVHLVLSGDHSHFYSLRNYYGHVDTFFDGTMAQGYFLNDDQFLVDHVASMPASDGTPTMFQFHVMSTHVLRKRENIPGKFQPAERYLLRNSHDIGAATVAAESATNFYDNGVLRTDTVIRDLLAALGRKGYLSNTLVVITADHGESLGEHGLFQHANSVREQLLRIPVVLISYGYQPTEAIDPHTFASQVDIAPTILAELGLPRPSTWAGRPLQDAAETDFTYFEEHDDLGLIDHRRAHDPWKYWTNIRTGEQHVFDLGVDPDEHTDAAHSVPPARLGEWRLRALSGTPSRPVVRQAAGN